MAGETGLQYFRIRWRFVDQVSSIYTIVFVKTLPNDGGWVTTKVAHNVDKHGILWLMSVGISFLDN